MFSTVIVIFALALNIALAIAMILKYLRTRDAGFIWLGVAVVIWPIVSRLINEGESMGIDRVMNHLPVGFFPFTLVERGQMTMGEFHLIVSSSDNIISVGLLLIAVFYLCRTKPGGHLEDTP